jgi:hypothetical protein
MRGRGAVVGLLLLALMAPAGCGSANNTANPSDDQRIAEQTKELDALAQKRDARLKELGAMSFADLSRTLSDEAAKNSAMGAEPFNSMAYAEMVKRGNAVAPSLTALFETGGNDLFNLLALRAVSRPAYDAVDPQRRADILVAALGRSVCFNTWGIPHLQWHDAAQAILELGKPAEPGLRRLLDDARPAPSWGPEEAAEYAAYGYRVRDYAWALLREIGGARHGDIPRDPAQRDPLMDAVPR